MAKAIFCNSIVVHYDKFEGAPVSGRVISGLLMIKHVEGLSDRPLYTIFRKTCLCNIFLGYTSFTNEEPFSNALFEEIRKRLSFDLLSKMNEVIVLHCLQNIEGIANDK